MPRRRACACGKKTFPSRGKALAVVESLRRVPRGEQEYAPVRAYPCPLGAGWHLTSQDGDRAAIYAQHADRRSA